MAENNPDVGPCAGQHADGTTVDSETKTTFTSSLTMRDDIITYEEFKRTKYPDIKNSKKGTSLSFSGIMRSLTTILKDRTQDQQHEYLKYVKTVIERQWNEKPELDDADMARRRCEEEPERAEELHENEIEELRLPEVKEKGELGKVVEAERRKEEDWQQRRIQEVNSTRQRQEEAEKKLQEKERKRVKEELHENEMEKLKLPEVKEKGEIGKVDEVERKEEDWQQRGIQEDNSTRQQQEEAEKKFQEKERKRVKEKEEVAQKQPQERAEEEAGRNHESHMWKQGFQQQKQLPEGVSQRMKKRKVEMEKEKEKLRKQREQKQFQRLAEEEKERKNREEIEIRRVEAPRKTEQESQEKFRRQQEEKNAKISEKEKPLENKEREEKRSKQVEELKTESKHIIEQERSREEEEAKRRKDNDECKQGRPAKLEENRKKLDEELALKKNKVLSMQKEAIEQMKRRNEEALIAAQRRGQASAAQLGTMMRQIYDKGIKDGMMIIKKKSEEAKFRGNGALILHDGGASSVDIADQLANMLISRGFIVPQPLLDTGEQPPCPARCHLTLLVMYVVLFEDQSAKRLHEVVRTASQYLSNSVFHECSKLFIVQCQSQPEKDIRRLLRSMGNTTAIVAGLPRYHQDIFEKFLSKTTSFDGVPDKLIDHAKTQSQCISNS